MEPPHLPTEKSAASCPQTTGRCLSPVPPKMRMTPQPHAISAIRAENPKTEGLGGGEGGIRTLGTGYPVRQISNLVPSTTRPPLRSWNLTNPRRFRRPALSASPRVPRNSLAPAIANVRGAVLGTACDILEPAWPNVQVLRRIPIFSSLSSEPVLDAGYPGRLHAPAVKLPAPIKTPSPVGQLGITGTAPNRQLEDSGRHRQ